MDHHTNLNFPVGPILYSGKTLSYEDVQQRAMDCHGGFESHNQMWVTFLLQGWGLLLITLL